MNETTELLACCGLYCGDCAGYSGEIADRTRELLEVLERYRFELTAKHLFSDKLGEYDKLQQMLGFMTELKCPAVCRHREDGTTSCEIRKCCREKGFFACHECDSLEACDKLKLMEPLHGDSCVRNLRAIKEMGLEAWVTGGKRLWFGTAVEEAP